jgi:ATP-dependent HslUV protease ATP-binding subunit HslU
MEELTPRQIVAELDHYIVGQSDAKRAVAVAIRNRWRRRQLPEEMRKEVAPKNIIMIGSTGVGKTEIARRLAGMVKAPFTKVEASKFTEVGYVGRDVESIIRELTEAAVNLVRSEHLAVVESRAGDHADERLLDLLVEQKGDELAPRKMKAAPTPTPEPSPEPPDGSDAGDDAKPDGDGTPTIDFSAMVKQVQQQFPGLVSDDMIAKATEAAQEAARKHGIKIPGSENRPSQPAESAITPPVEAEDEERRKARIRAELRQRLIKGELDAIEIELRVAGNKGMPFVEVFSNQGVEQMGMDFADLFDRISPNKSKVRRVSVSDARKILRGQEGEKLIDRDKIIEEARRRVEEMGIVFIDEVDKICSSDDFGEGGSGQPHVSREGVQRDLLPIIEGSVVNTKYGPVATDHILFIAAGAFHNASPSDLIPELQGRFPVRVELDDLDREDLVRILTEPKNALIKQYQALLKTDGITLAVPPDGVEEIARVAETVNDRHINIGARRLHTILERLLEDIAFQAPELGQRDFILDREAVILKMSGIVEDDDLSRFQI